MRLLLQKLTMVKGLQETACVGSAAYSNCIKPAGYREAVKALNLLQTNASVLQEVRNKRKQGIVEKKDKILETYKYLNRSGVSLDQLDSLPIIHVAGTKGKGSTCAFCESILRHWAKGSNEQTWRKRREAHDGIRTGLFISPHLVEVRERIQLNGKPISQELFALHFWNVYNALLEKRDHDDDMPPYFKFLTVLAFNVFIKEGVDVAIFEVGIGGEYDCTNIIRKPVAVGITSLGIDHTCVLGKTLEEIAWQKAGIFKKGAPAFTALGQDPAAMSVLKDRAKEKEVRLKLSPPLLAYSYNGHSLAMDLNLSSKVQEINASLALQLANAWIHWVQNSSVVDNDVMVSEICMAQPFEVNSFIYSGLKKCCWPGRTQILHLPNSNNSENRLKPFGTDLSFTFFLDGAHTFESVQLCMDWFKEATHLVERSDNNGIVNPDDTMRVLIFNSTGRRDVEVLLSPFARSKLFHLVLFSTNSPTLTVDPHSDLTRFLTCKDQQKSRCEEHLQVWLKYNNHIPAYVFSCVSDALSYLQNLPSSLPSMDYKYRKVHVLVSGSLHLVGSVLSIVDPDLSCIHSSGEPDSNKSETNVTESSLKCDMAASSSGTSIQYNAKVYHDL